MPAHATFEFLVTICHADDRGEVTSRRGTALVEAWGETSFFYNPGKRLPRGVYFATLKQKDGDNDKASKLDRNGVFHLNLDVSKATYTSMFGGSPKRPAKGGVVATGHGFDELDLVMPHPVYGWMSWICVLNPFEPTFDKIKPLLEEAYCLAVAKFANRIKTGG